MSFGLYFGECIYGGSLPTLADVKGVVDLQVAFVIVIDKLKYVDDIKLIKFSEKQLNNWL